MPLVHHSELGEGVFLCNIGEFIYADFVLSCCEVGLKRSSVDGNPGFAVNGCLKFEMFGIVQRITFTFVDFVTECTFINQVEVGNLENVSVIAFNGIDFERIITESFLIIYVECERSIVYIFKYGVTSRKDSSME